MTLNPENPVPDESPAEPNATSEAVEPTSDVAANEITPASGEPSDAPQPVTEASASEPEAASSDSETPSSEAETPNPVIAAAPPVKSRPRLAVFLLGVATGGCLLTMIAGAIFFVTGGWSKPLGPTLMPPVDRAESITPIVTPPFVPNTGLPDDAQVQTICGGPPEMILLAVGTDLNGLGDVTRVVRADFVTPSISLLSFPRDLWVPIADITPKQQEGLTGYFGIVPWLEKDQLGYGRINTAWSFGNASGGLGGGAVAMADTIYLNFGLNVEHYVAVKMQTMGNVIDALGGVDLNVPYEVPGFSAGPQHMNGDQAVSYARIRSIDDDWHRQDRQTLVLRAMREKVLQADSVGSLPRIIDLALKEVTTDLSREQIAMLTCLGLEVETEDFNSYQVTREYITSAKTTHGSFVLVPQYDKIAVLIAKFLSGIPQNEPLPGEAAPTPTTTP